MATYHQHKQAFISGNSGSNSSDVAAVALAALLTHLAWTLSLRCFRPLYHPHPPSGALLAVPSLELLILVWPLLGVCTLFANKLWTTNLGLGCACLAWWGKITWPATKQKRPAVPTGPGSLRPHHLSPVQRAQTLDPCQASDSGLGKPCKQLDPSLGKPFYQPFVTVYRSQLMLVTAIAILAVDFQVFPRKFAKTETWGVSLMDLGVGSFVFSLGVVSAVPILNRSPISAAPLGDACKATKKIFPLVLIGLARILFLKALDYPEHVSEYGTHWNFFFTLALLPITGIMARRLLERYRINLAALGVLLTLVYQCALVLTGLEGFVVSNAPRDNLLSANREGLASIPGFMAIYLFGLSTGCYCLAPTPDYLRKAFFSTGSSPKLSMGTQGNRVMTTFAGWAITWWSAYLLSAFLISPASRRLANPTYCFWVSAANVTFLAGHRVLQDLQGALYPHRPLVLPRIFESFNNNSLAVFLLANLLTGAVNLSTETMFASDLRAMTILASYSTGLVLLSYLLSHGRLKW